MSFNFHLPTKIIFGENEINQLESMIQGRKVLIVTDPIIKNLGIIDKLCVNGKDTEYRVFHQVEPNPSCTTVNLCMLEASGFQGEETLVVGVGGGSSLDAAKAVSALLCNQGTMEDFFYGKRQLNGKRAGLVLVPTTAGTGSEVTSVSVLQDNATGIKKPLVNPCFYADCAIVDPSFTYSMPASVTASTGWDALCHAIEAYWSINSLPVSDQLSLEATRLVLGSLMKAYLNPSDKKARNDMSLASLLAGMAFSQTRTTIVHAVAYPFTSMFHIPHGTACAMTLVPFLDYNYSAIKQKMDILLNFCNISSIGTLTDLLKDMQIKTNIPTSLSAAGIGEKDIDVIVEDSLKLNIAGFNPRKVDEQDLKQILKSLL